MFPIVTSTVDVIILQPLLLRHDWIHLELHGAKQLRWLSPVVDLLIKEPWATPNGCYLFKQILKENPKNLKKTKIKTSRKQNNLQKHWSNNKQTQKIKTRKTNNSKKSKKSKI